MLLASRNYGSAKGRPHRSDRRATEGAQQTDIRTQSELVSRRVSTNQGGIGAIMGDLRTVGHKTPGKPPERPSLGTTVLPQ
eukprot:8077117-Pyramimonas_sp.AAC.1